MKPVAVAGRRQFGRAATARAVQPHLVMNYRPSQPHGWPAAGPDQGVGVTTGGHITSQNFTHNGRRYRIRLIPFDQPTDSPNPIYEDVPVDATTRFRRTLADALGAYYSFHYVGGLHGRGEFDVQSYSVHAVEQTEASPLRYGADLYVVYNPYPGRGEPAIHPALRWIQVARSLGTAGPSESTVDDGGRANPFYVSGGLTSIDGKRVFNFYYGAETAPLPSGDAVLSDQFIAEAFLVRDTGIKDAAGRAIITVFGGIKYGWQVREVAT